MVRNAKWQKFEDLICALLQEIDSRIRPTKGSGNSTENYDINTSCGLAIECKDYNTDSVYQEKWMQKVIEEVPLHVERLPVLFTRNKDGKIRAHLDGEDFIKMYIEFYKLKQG